MNNTNNSQTMIQWLKTIYWGYFVLFVLFVLLSIVVYCWHIVTTRISDGESFRGMERSKPTKDSGSLPANKNLAMLSMMFIGVQCVIVARATAVSEL